MPDVRKYLVSYGLETLLGQLCNNNGLELCDDSGNPINFGEDDYYSQIFLPDFRGFDFVKQRDAWREGVDFSFVAEFYAKSEAEAAASMGGSVVEGEVVEEASSSAAADVVDTEIVVDAE